MKVFIFICLIAITDAFTTQEIVKKFDGNEDYSFNIELKDNTIIKNTCFFTSKNMPKTNPDYKKLMNKINYMFLPREDMILTIKKNDIKNIVIAGSKSVIFTVLKNYDIIYYSLVRKNNTYNIYNSNVFGKIKIKKRNILAKSPVTLNKDNQTIIIINRSMQIPKSCKSIKGLRDLKNIISLKLSNSKVVDISPIKDLKALKTLDLSNSKVVDISPIKDLKALKTLILSKSKVVDISSIKDLKLLRSLDLSNSKVVDISPVKDLKSLDTLVLSKSEVVDINPIKDLSLKHLNLSHSKINDVTVINSLNKLKYLNLSHNKISDISFLKNLSIIELNLYNNQVVNIEVLKSLKELKYLNLSHNKIADIRSFRNIVLSALNLSHNQIANISMLNPFSNFQELNLSHNKIANIDVLKYFPHLRTLNLSNNTISNFSSLKKISNIEELNIANNSEFDCQIINDLAKLKKLNMLHTKLINGKEINKISKSLHFLSFSKGDINIPDTAKISFVHFDFNNKNNLKQVMNYKMFAISFAGFKGDFAFLKNLYPCKTLNFRDTNFTDLALLQNQVGTLRYLDLTNCPIKDFSFLKKFKQLIVYISATKEELNKLSKQYPHIRFIIT